MAICRIIKTGATPEQYDQVGERVGAGGTQPPGGVLHIGAVGEDGTVRVIEVWDSREQAEEWSRKVMAVREELGIGGQPEISYYDVRRLTQRPA